MKRTRYLGLLKRNSTAYRFGRLQTSFDRALRQLATAWLQPYSLSPIEWLLLGIVHDHPLGLHPRGIAVELGIKPPLVTVLVGRLKRKLLITVQPRPADGRSLLVRPSSKGAQLIHEIERHFRSQSRPLFRSISMVDVVTFLELLELALKNARRLTSR